MASRRETQLRKAELERHLRELSQSDEAKKGFRMPAHRELADSFGVSTHTVFRTIRRLQEEGVLHSAAGVGVFARRPPDLDRIFCFVNWMTEGDRFRQLYYGFSTELATAGCLSAQLTGEEGERWLITQGEGIVAGVFATYKPTSGLESFLDVPHVGFYEHTLPTWDQALFDDEEGGWLAAHHLIECGHRSLAFLGWHSSGRTGEAEWSGRRQEGFDRAIRESGATYRGSASLIPIEEGPEQSSQMMLATEKILASSHITGVVAVNGDSARLFLNCLSELGAAKALWPSVVCFQDSDVMDLPNVSYIALDYMALGRTAARLLIDRTSGSLPSERAVKLSPIRLIPSLTSHPHWALRPAASLRLLAHSVTAG